MPSRILRFYRRNRVVNINVNIIVAGLAAIALAKGPIYLAAPHVKKFAAEHGLRESISQTVVAAGIDVAFDIVIYFALHWWANHFRKEPAGTATPPPTPHDVSGLGVEVTIADSPPGAIVTPDPAALVKRAAHGPWLRFVDFLTDAIRIQAERTVLVPIFFLIATLLMAWLIERGWTSSWAYVIAFTTAVFSTRIIHTVWGLYSGSFKSRE